jgi:hypothetical protein
MSGARPVPLVVVTGDVVSDHHLYGGVKTAATSFSEPGTEYKGRLGGAALTCALLHAGAGAAGDKWEVQLGLAVPASCRPSFAPTACGRRVQRGGARKKASGAPSATSDMDRRRPPAPRAL